VPRRKGISPVIATVIIVAVTIAVAIAVAFWMTGIVGLFTGFEQVQIVSAVPSFDSNTNQFTITLTVKNTGTATASIDNLFINGVPFNNPINVQWGGAAWNPGAAQTLAPGQQVQITIRFNDQTNWAGGTLTHGVSVEVKLHTASGKEYPKLVVLP
jgi:flagellin-like protein